LTDTLFDLPPVVKAAPVTRAPKRSFIAEVEAALKAARLPYVDVDQAKRALFEATELQSFHFVVYQEGRDNWLMWCGSLRKDTREDMNKWAEVFGKGFQVVYARRTADGITYRDDAGKKLGLTTRGGVS
jgi:hypothetical protein